MRPINFDPTDLLPDLIEKLRKMTDDVYRRFEVVDNEVVSFTTGDVVPQQVVVSVDSDEVNTDITTHETTYDHDQLHTRLHDIDSTGDHNGVSGATADNLVDFDANGLPADSGIAGADVSSILDFKISVVSKSANYTATVSDDLILCTGTITISLPAVSGVAGKLINIKNIDTGTVTVDGNAAETIDGSATQTLAQYEALQIVAGPSEWHII